MVSLFVFVLFDRAFVLSVLTVNKRANLIRIWLVKLEASRSDPVCSLTHLNFAIEHIGLKKSVCSICIHYVRTHGICKTRANAQNLRLAKGHLSVKSSALFAVWIQPKTYSSFWNKDSFKFDIEHTSTQLFVVPSLPRCPFSLHF